MRAAYPRSRFRLRRGGFGRVAAVTRIWLALLFSLAAGRRAGRARGSGRRARRDRAGRRQPAARGAAPGRPPRRPRGRAVPGRASCSQMDPHWHVYWRNSGQSGAAAAAGLAASTARRSGRSRGRSPRSSARRTASSPPTATRDEVLLISRARGVRARRARARSKPRVDADVPGLRGAVHSGRAPARAHDPRRRRAPRSPIRETHAFFEELAARVPRAPAELGVELEAVYSLSAIRPDDAFRAALAVRACARRRRASAQTCAELEPGTSDATDSFVPDRIDGIELAGRRRAHARRSSQGGFLLTMDGHARARTRRRPSGAAARRARAAPRRRAGVRRGRRAAAARGGGRERARAREPVARAGDVRPNPALGGAALAGAAARARGRARPEPDAVRAAGARDQGVRHRRARAATGAAR